MEAGNASGEVKMGEAVNIPRLFTVCAQIMACGIFISLRGRKRPLPVTLSITVVIFIAEYLFSLLVTPKLPIALLPINILLMIALMYLYMFTAAKGDALTLGYCTTKAFLAAEFMASLEWQISYFFKWNERLPELSQLLIALGSYAIVCLIIRWVEIRSFGIFIDREISVNEFIVACVVGAAIFCMSNISFFFSNTLFSGSNLFDMFNLRTLFDLMGILILYAFQSRIAEIESRADLAAMDRTLREQYDKYRNYQEHIEVINMKYHDLKHQLEDIRELASEDGQRILIDNVAAELKEYKPFYDTGNPVLNAVLDSRRAICIKREIRITAVADGKLLDFMSVADVCTVFGNALDNAVEAVSLIPEPERRLIHLEVAANKGFVRIRVENACETEVTFRDGLPVTGKKDNDLHGLGTRSIQRVVRKYEGTLSFACKEDWFSLRILIPRK